MSPIDPKPEYIIIAEDDEGHAAAISRALNAHLPGCRLDLVTCISDFRKAATKRTPDIALLDLNLKDGSALELLTLPAENAVYPVLIMTSHGSEQLAVKALKSGALDYVVKTAESLADIGYIVQRVLQQWQMLKERQHSTEDLRQREIRFHALAENAPDIIARFDDGCRYIYVNNLIKRKLGILATECIGRKNTEIGVPDEIGAVWDRTVRNVLTTGHESSATLRYENKTKEICFFHTMMVPEFDEHGKVATVLSITRDITNQRRVEETLRESETKYRTLVENANEAICVTQGDSIIFCNSAMCRLTGFEMDRLISMRMSKVIHTEDLAAFKEWQTLSSVERGKSPAFRFDRAAGGFSWVELSAVGIEWENQKDSWLYFISDITERKIVDEEKQRLAKLDTIKIMASGIAHDFNNILTAIIGNIGLLKNYIPDTKEAISILTEAENASMRAKGLSRQLLTFARGSDYNKTTVALPNLLREITSLPLRGSNVSVSYSFADDLRCIEADEEQLSQVITNLTINAVQAMPDGGRFEVRAENVPDEHLPAKMKKRKDTGGLFVRLSFVDSGIGIPPENLKRIFDPFFTTKHSGNGLGLASTVSIVEAHNGYIDVASEVGVGTTFSIYLPSTGSSVAKPVLTEPSLNFDMSRVRVLVMDDEAPIRDITCRLLQHIGVMEGVAVADGAAALSLYQNAMLKKEPFSAVILDLTVIGGKGGIETLGQLKEMDPGVRAILSSGYASANTIEEYQKLGFCGFIDKPYTLTQLKEILAKVIGHR